MDTTKHTFKIGEFASKFTLFLLALVFMLGAASADGLVHEGRMLLLGLMLFGPIGVMYVMKRMGWLDWIDEEYGD